MRGRGGYTLAELTVATAISVIVLASVVSTFVTAQRMLHAAMAESELSLAMREMREKLLFKASPDVNGRHYAGLLSGSGLNENGVRGFDSVEMTCPSIGATLASKDDASMRILAWKVGGDTVLMNERTPDKDRHAHWLMPGCVGMDGFSRLADVLNFESWSENGSGVYRLSFDLALKAEVRGVDGQDVVRKERVQVPLFGRIQPFKDGKGRY